MIRRIPAALNSSFFNELLSRFFWRMVEKSAEGSARLPCEGSAQYWTEKLYNSIGGYLERAGYAGEWDEEIDKA